MTSGPAGRTSRERVAAHRRRLRAHGLRQIQLTVLDVRSEAFRREAARQSRLVAAAAEEDEAMGFVEAVSDFDE